MYMAKRTGLFTIRILARKICDLYTKFYPVVVLLPTATPALLAALTAVNAACAEVVIQINDVEQFES